MKKSVVSIAVVAFALAAGSLCVVSANAANFGGDLPKGEAVAIDVAAAKAADFAGKPQLFAGRITEDDWAAGRDAQLETAVQLALEALDKQPPPVPPDSATGPVKARPSLPPRPLGP